MGVFRWHSETAARRLHAAGEPAYRRLAPQTLERGKFDAFFIADQLAVLNMSINTLKRSHTVTSFDPLTLRS